MTDRERIFDLFEDLGDDVVESFVNSNYATLEDVIKAPDSDLMKVKGIGAATVKKIREKLVEVGFSTPTITPDDVPKKEKYKGGNVYSRGNYVKRYDGALINIRNGDDLREFPAKLVEEMNARNETMAKPVGR